MQASDLRILLNNFLRSEGMLQTALDDYCQESSASWPNTICSSSASCWCCHRRHMQHRRLGRRPLSLRIRSWHWGVIIRVTWCAKDRLSQRRLSYSFTPTPCASCSAGNGELTGQLKRLGYRTKDLFSEKISRFISVQVFNWRCHQELRSSWCPQHWMAYTSASLARTPT